MPARLCGVFTAPDTEQSAPGLAGRARRGRPEQEKRRPERAAPPELYKGALRGIPPLEGGVPETGLSRVPVRGKAVPLMTSKTVLRAFRGAACFSDTARDQTFPTHSRCADRDRGSVPRAWFPPGSLPWRLSVEPALVDATEALRARSPSTQTPLAMFTPNAWRWYSCTPKNVILVRVKPHEPEGP